MHLVLYVALLSTCCRNLERNLEMREKIWEKAGVKFCGDLTGKSVIVSTLATSKIWLLVFFGEDYQ